MNFFDLIQPYIGQLGFGGLAGFAVGYFIKAVGKVAAIVVGFIIVVVQTLASMGYFSVDWAHIQKDADPIVSGGGLQHIWDTAMKVLTANMPFGTAFIAGIVLGIRKG